MQQYVRECNSVCARGLLLKSSTSLPYGPIKWEADYREDPMRTEWQPIVMGHSGLRDLVPVAMQAAWSEPVKPAAPVLTCGIFPKEGKYIVLKKTLVTKTRE